MNAMAAPLLQAVDETISRYSMLPRGARAGVAVSGGADSVCLLDVLAVLAPERGWRLEVLHVNHGWRGAESDADEAFAGELARARGLPFHSGRAAPAAGNREEAARAARLEFFARCRDGFQLDRIATGHTRDDQAETVLFRALRGAGPGGLAGILPVTREGLVRPLLGVGREEILAWNRGRGLEWREDSSNSDTALRRNWIREALLPAASRRINARAGEALARLAAIVRDEEAYWDGVVAERAARVFQRRTAEVMVRREELLAEGPAMARRLVREAMREVRGGLRRVEQQHVEAVLELALAARGGGRLRLPELEVTRSFDWLRFGLAAAPPAPCIAVTGSGEWALPGVDGATVSICVPPGAAGAHLRGWRPGDRIHQAGARACVPLRDLFQRDKTPRWERPTWPVLESGGALVWAKGYGLAEGAREAGWQVAESGDARPPMAI